MVYKLAQNAYNLRATYITIIDDEGQTIGTVRANQGVPQYQGVDYELVCDDAYNLTLKILNMPSITVSADPEDWTCGGVTLTVKGNQNGKFEYWNDDTNSWVILDEGTDQCEFAVKENQEVKFQFTNEHGKTVTETFVVDNIDFLAPGAIRNITPTLSANSVTVDWDDVVDNEGGIGFETFLFRYGKSEEGLGEIKAVEITESQITVNDLGPGKWYFQIASTDQLGNVSEWSETQSFVVASPQLSWESETETGAVVKFSTGDKYVAVETTGQAVDILSLPEGVLKWEVENNAGSPGSGKIAGGGSPEAERFESTENTVQDIFFACAAGVWESGFAARHQTTKEEIVLEGMNRFDDVFAGSNDANILLLTDDANGDAFFVDDVYTALGNRARFSQIDEIRAGAGNDIIDMTSNRFIYEGGTICLRGGDGDDVLWGGKGNSILCGDAGNDQLVGDAGNDIFFGGTGNDTMNGGGGNDEFYFSGDWGTDSIKQQKKGSVTLYIENGSINQWDAEKLTYTDGDNIITITGCSNVTLNFGSSAEWSFSATEHSSVFITENVSA